MSILRILHLVGSAESDFYGDLSRLYAQDCLTATASPAYDFQIAYITPDRLWRFPESLHPEAIAAAEPMPLSDAIRSLTARQIDLVLPQMFCLSGMTHYRALFDLLQIPYLGNCADAMALTAQKARAKAVVAAAGVKVPQGELLHRGDWPTLLPPAVVKPANADNSLGVTFVQTQADYAAALNAAFEYDDEILVEEFIELGREVRCGVIVQQEELVGLPLEEYAVNRSDTPIRSHSEKLKRQKDGSLGFAAKDQLKSWIVAPSDPASDPATQRVQEIAKQCHLALGCRHYSLFDFRIDPQGQPWFLEAGLYCSFSPKSVIVTMAEAAGIPLDQLLQMLIRQAV